MGPLTVPPADSNSIHTSPDTDASAADPEPRAARSWRAPPSSERSLSDLFNDDHLTFSQEDEEDPEHVFVPPDPGPIMDGDPLLTLAWCCALGRPLIVIILA